MRVKSDKISRLKMEQFLGLQFCGECTRNTDSGSWKMGCFDGLQPLQMKKLSIYEEENFMKLSYEISYGDY